MTAEPLTIVLAEDDDGHASLIHRNLQRARPDHRLHPGPRRPGGARPAPRRRRARRPGDRGQLPRPARHQHAEARRRRGPPPDQGRPVAGIDPRHHAHDDRRPPRGRAVLSARVQTSTSPSRSPTSKFVEAIRQLGLFLQVVKVPPNGASGRGAHGIAMTTSRGRVGHGPDPRGRPRGRPARAAPARAGGIRRGRGRGHRPTRRSGRSSRAAIDLMVLDFQLDGLTEWDRLPPPDPRRRLRRPVDPRDRLRRRGRCSPSALRAGIRDFLPKTPDYLDFLVADGRPGDEPGAAPSGTWRPGSGCSCSSAGSGAASSTGSRRSPRPA